jgi:RimJ/RimL family protein N-acetyltransferase
MTIYGGSPLVRGEVSLHPPHRVALEVALRQAQLTDDAKSWYGRARSNDEVVYFAVSHRGGLVGQIMLHDIDLAEHAALVGYHVFSEADRGLGIGTAALSLLCDYAFREMKLSRLVAITGVENIASQRIAEKCGFRNIGPPREGAHLAAFERT